jgi:molybdopterin-guanine dinucleotide biosynthesis protein
MAISFRPAVRENTPLIIGIAGPSKSGKTYSAHRLAQGLAGGGLVAMINAEGARGHQYAERFKYQACDIDPPYSYARYDEALQAAAALKPACVIVDSVSHAHDGPGGMIEEHDAEVERRAGDDFKKRDRVTWAAWIKPKQAENKFIYRMLSMNCPVILCFRAKEKLKIVPGKEPIDLGYQPIASDRIAFETIFSLMLPPRSKGVPDLSLSDLREPFDQFIKPGMTIDEKLGVVLADWAAGAKAPESAGEVITEDQAIALEDRCREHNIPVARLCAAAKVAAIRSILAADHDKANRWIDRRVQEATQQEQPSQPST